MPEEWGNILARDIQVDENEAAMLAQYAFQSDKRKTIVFFGDVWVLGGIERVVSVLLDKLKDDYRLILITTKKRGEELPQGFTIPQEIPHIHLIRSVIPMYLQISSLCLAIGADLLIGNPNIEAMFMPAYEELEGSRVKTIAINHYFYYLPYQYMPYQYMPLYRVKAVREQTLQYADAVVWLTRFSTACAQKMNPRSVCIPNPNTYSSMPSRTLPDEKIVMSIGRFYDPLKRIDRTLIIFKKVLERHPDAKLWLVGKFNRRMIIPGTKGKRLWKLLYELNIPKESIVFWDEQKEVQRYYQKASVLLFPSECEGYGMVLKEAGVAGTPVVVNDFPGSEDIIDQGKNGYRVNLYRNEYDKAVDYIGELLSNDELWIRMSRESQVMAEKTNADEIASKWKALIEAVFASSSTKRFKESLADMGILLTDEEKRISLKRANEFLEQLIETSLADEKKSLYLRMLDVFYYLRGAVARTRYLLKEVGIWGTCKRLVNKIKRRVYLS